MSVLVGLVRHGAHDDLGTWLSGRTRDIALNAAGRDQTAALARRLAGRGIAMGRAALVLDDVIAGRLVPLFGRSVVSHAAYYYVTLPQPGTAMQWVGEWLIQEGRRFAQRRASVLPPPA